MGAGLLEELRCAEQRIRDLQEANKLLAAKANASEAKASLSQGETDSMALRADEAADRADAEAERADAEAERADAEAERADREAERAVVEARRADEAYLEGQRCGMNGNSNLPYMPTSQDRDIMVEMQALQAAKVSKDAEIHALQDANRDLAAQLPSATSG